MECKMKKPLVATVAFLVLSGALITQVCAHYLWVTIDTKTGDHGTTNVYFEGGPGPGDGKYLDPFIANGKTWIQTLDADKPVELEMETVEKPNSRWLSATLPKPGPRSITSYGKYGVYFYKNIKKDVLLHYYGKNLDAKTTDELDKLGRSEQLTLDIVPRCDGDDIELTVLWQGKPAANCQVKLNGPKGLNEQPKTDDKGQASFTPKAPGLYRLYAMIEVKESGKDDGNDYELIRHQIRVLVRLPLK